MKQQRSTWSMMSGKGGRTHGRPRHAAGSPSRASRSHWRACGLAAALAVSLARAGHGDPAPSAAGAPPGHPSHSHESMREVPRLQPKRVVTVTGREDWDALRGFGKDTPMAAMMTLMMVGGSGMEHMKMASMKRSGVAGEEYTEAVGAHAEPDSAAPRAGVRPATLPGGVSVAAAVIPNPPVVGDILLTLTLTDAQGKPLTGAKLAASLAMTSMDMGITHPTLKEGPAGQYTTTLHFSMAGPWRVTLAITPANGQRFTRSFDFTIRS